MEIIPRHSRCRLSQMTYNIIVESIIIIIIIIGNSSKWGYRCAWAPTRMQVNTYIEKPSRKRRKEKKKKDNVPCSILALFYIQRHVEPDHSPVYPLGFLSSLHCPSHTLTHSFPTTFVIYVDMSDR